MENIKNFLQSSTIHGLTYIATSKKFLKLFWILVVIGGFTGAGILIHQSFRVWEDSPVKTTIETLPIKNIKFPKVTVCPPRNTYTNLNYDLMMTENMTLSNETRNELVNYALKVVNEFKVQEVFRNLSMLEDGNRYYNWYYGFTDKRTPELRYDEDTLQYYAKFEMKTGSVNGNVRTKNFRGKFNEQDLDNIMVIDIKIFPPHMPKHEDKNITLFFEIELDPIYVGFERLKIFYGDYGGPFKDMAIWLNAKDTQLLSKNLTFNVANNKRMQLNVQYARVVDGEDVKNLNLVLMPGFRMKWCLLDRLDNIPHKEDLENKEFRRFVNLFNRYKNLEEFMVKVTEVRIKYLKQNLFDNCGYDGFIQNEYIQHNNQGNFLSQVQFWKYLK